MGNFNRAAVEGAVWDLLRAFGEDPERDGLRETPGRVGKMYSELLDGEPDLGRILDKRFPVGHSELVMVSGIAFSSMCEHHLLPYVGEAAVGYIPAGDVVGLSKLARLVRAASHRLSVQESLTTLIADTLVEALKPVGVMVVIKAEHSCMTLRGVMSRGATTTTSAVRGVFENEDAARAEFLRLME